MSKKNIDKYAIKDGLIWGMIISSGVIVGKSWLNYAAKQNGLMRVIATVGAVGIGVATSAECYAFLPNVIDTIGMEISNRIEVNVEHEDAPVEES